MKAEEPEAYRPASLGRYCLREMQMEDFTERALTETLERLCFEKFGGVQLSFPTDVMPYGWRYWKENMTSRIESPPIAPI